MDTTDYIRIERALRYLAERTSAQPTLAQVADHVGLSEHHLQRVFTRWAGISPKRFLQFQTVETAKSLLRDSRSVLDTTYSTGLSSGGRLHDLFVTLEAMTPGEFKAAGAGLLIRTGVHDSPFGECVLAMTDRGICGLGFVVDGDRAAALAEVASHWPGATFVRDQHATEATAHRVFEAWGRTPWHLRNGATRAVGTAIGRNPVAYLIPCHRVIRKTGAFGGYHWGSARKAAMLLCETAGRDAVALAAS